jgi:RNA polymerase sigma-70 factor, ECF subfamily
VAVERRDLGADSSGSLRNDQNRERVPRLIEPVKSNVAREIPVESGAELMLRFRSGDVGAFDVIVQRYQRSVLNTVFRYLGNRAVAEDVAQEVFVRIFRAARNYESKARFETWLHRIIFNLCANTADYARRRQTLSIDGGPNAFDNARMDIVAHERGAAETVLAAESVEAVRAAISRLPTQQRAALILSRYESLPYNEIADTLGVSLEAVKSLLFRARENLRDYLAPYLREEACEEL